MTKLCEDCPDHEACMTGAPCELVKRVNPPNCDTCGDVGTVPWMIEADPNCYVEPDADTRMPCLDCSYIVPPMFKWTRFAALEQIDPFELRIPACDGWCTYGDCDWRQCGGCCGCLGGCQVAHENGSIAPFLWEGDYA